MSPRLVALGAFLAAALGCSGTLYGDLPITAGDRRVLYTVGDLGRLYDLKVDPALASVDKRFVFDQTTLEYTYDATDSDLPDTIYIQTTLIAEGTDEGARRAYVESTDGLAAGAGDGERDDGQLTDFDAHECYAWRDEGRLVGAACAARHGKTVLVLAVSGVIFDGTLEDLLGDRLDLMRRWSP